RYTITNTLIENTERNDGIFAQDEADITVRSSIIRGNGRDGLKADGNRGSFFREVSNSTIENNGGSGIFNDNAKSPMTFQNNKILNNSAHGIFANVTEATTDTVLTIAGNRIENNQLVGIASSRAIILNDTLIGNYYPIATTGEISKAGTINENGNFYEDNFIQSNLIDSVTALFGKVNGKIGFSNPYGTANSVIVTDFNRLPKPFFVGAQRAVHTESGDSLHVNAGTVVKNSGPNSGIFVGGTLLSEGELDSKIVFTSFNDDTYAGNTNQDTTNIIPETRDWSGITLRNAGSDSSKIKNTIIRYADRALSIYNSDALVDSSAFSNSHYGIFFSNGSNSTVRFSEIHSNQFDGVYIDNNSDNNPVFQLNNFYGNGNSALINHSTNTIKAENNYWDDATGPLVDKGSDQNLGGLGEYINVANGPVDYRPFLTGRNGILLGDVTENGTISAFDASTILQHIVGITTISGNALAAADVTANGSVSAMDASFILQFVVGNITGFPGQGKKVPVDMTKAFELEMLSDSKFTEFELTNTGLTNISSTEIEFVIKNNPIKEVELLPSVFSENLSMTYRIDKDTVFIAIAGSKAMNEEGVFTKLRFDYGDMEDNRPLTDGMIYNKFILNETDLTEHLNQTQVSIDDGLSDIPLEFSLNQNYPNPFNPSTNISYGLPNKGHVKIQIYNIIGQLVQTLIDAPQQAGSYQMQWDASAFGSGTYLLRIDFEGSNNQSYSQIRKMLLIK
ncbi:MAG: right-handed parallel beta-helix repeat-containing protein, partial [Balneola sp.]